MDDPEPTLRADSKSPGGSDRVPSRPSSARPPRPGPLGWLYIYTRGLVLDQHLRRVTMFYAVLVPMLMMFVGFGFLGEWLEPHRHFYRFALYWLLCGWLTILAALLAVYDLLVVRLQARAAQRALRIKMLGEDVLNKDRDK